MPNRRCMVALGVLTSLSLGCAVPGHRLALSAQPDEHLAQDLPATSVRLVIDGAVAGTFHDVQGLDDPTGILGGDERLYSPGRPQFGSLSKGRPGRPNYGSLTLKRGRVTDSRLFDWYQKGGGDCDDTGSCVRKSGSIIYLDRAGKETMRYNFFEAWPVRYVGPAFDPRSQVHPVEEVEFVVEKVERG